MAGDSSSHFEKQSVHNLVSSGLSVAVGFVISVLIARTLGPSGRGLLDLVTTSVGLITLILGCSVPSAITHLTARHGGIPPSVAVGITGWGLSAAILTGVGLLLFPDVFIRLGLLPNGQSPFWSVYIVGMVLLSTWTALLRGVLVGRHALISVNRVEIACKIGSLGLFCALALAGRHEAGIFALAASSIAVVNLLAALFLLRDAKVPPISKAWQTILITALPLHTANVLHFLNQRIDVFFVQSARGSAEVGIYALAASLAQFVLLLSSSFALPLLPQISSLRNMQAAAEASAQVCRTYTALGALTAAGLAVTIPFLLPRLFGQAFNSSVPLLLILLPGVIASGLTSILVSYFVGIERPKINLFVALSAAVVTVVGNASLTPRFGAVGAALTSTACYIFSAVVSVSYFARVSGVIWQRLLWPDAADWRAILKLAGRFRP